MDHRKTLDKLFERVEEMRREELSAGTKYRLQGLVADITDVAQVLKRSVLDVARHEAMLDLDEDVDYMEMAERVMGVELTECFFPSEELTKQTQLVNEALGVLSDLLREINEQLRRPHRSEEFASLYESEKRRYRFTKAAGKARQNFEEWREMTNGGEPTMEDIEDYRLGKLVKMFEKGVFAKRVEQIQRAKRYPGEIDFEQIDDDNEMKRTAYRHYAALRKLVDFEDGMLVVDPVRAGRYFYAIRHEKNAKQNRTNFLKYMHKISMAQELYEGLKMENGRLNVLRTAEGAEKAEELNMFAPAKQLKVMLGEEWFGIHSTDKRFDKAWTEQFIDRLMASPHGREIAIEWSNKKKRDFLRGCIVGLLKEGGVLKGSMDSIARSTGVCENYRTFSKYMGQSVQEPYAEWVLNYIKE
ncbi:MAG: hypothetical protein IJK45_01060 [Bacteroidaceae bacterium]|nr:hypothetical protein [Bacteroidaceae bacterium]